MSRKVYYDSNGNEILQEEAMKTCEEIVETVVADWESKHASDLGWLKSRIQGAWNSGYANAEAQARVLIESVKKVAYDEGNEHGKRMVEQGLPSQEKAKQILEDCGWLKEFRESCEKAYIDKIYCNPAGEIGKAYERGMQDCYKSLSNEDCIEHLRKSGWLQDHDKQIEDAINAAFRKGMNVACGILEAQNEIEKQKTEWPQDSDTYYEVDDMIEVFENKFSKGSGLSEHKLKVGNCFRTKEEAEAARDRIREVLKEP